MVRGEWKVVNYMHRSVESFIEMSLAFIFYSVSNAYGANRRLGVQRYGTTVHASSSLSRHSTPKVQ